MEATGGDESLLVELVHQGKKGVRGKKVSGTESGEFTKTVPGIFFDSPLWSRDRQGVVTSVPPLPNGSGSEIDLFNSTPKLEPRPSGNGCSSHFAASLINAKAWINSSRDREGAVLSLIVQCKRFLPGAARSFQIHRFLPGLKNPVSYVDPTNLPTAAGAVLLDP